MSADAIVAYIDGGARGNPGPAGYGVRVERPDGTLVEEFSGAIGVATNNVAEYRGLLAALEWARRHSQTRLHVRSDSLLLVQQMLGNYKVKNAGLQPLHAKARLLAHEIGRVTFEHVERARNAHADRLANAAMDGAARDAVKDPPAAESVAPASAASGSSQTSPFSPLERAVRLFIYRHFVNTGAAPDTASTARAVKAPQSDIEAALRRLADAHAIVLAPATMSIWMAHPFSAVPTAFPVVSGGRTYWANCAWDAAGVLSLVGDGDVRTRCPDCGEQQTLAVRGGQMIGDAVVHYTVPPRRFWDNVAYT